ncbi:hypothetical protein HU200_064389 [Digitaria exilis]|uniref:non-specific serine/threonine protein kinase n=1 Tax=Digitaria exilis TaxID=1010633 RepID=A0A835DVJ2_9POAL|nr:hypothetical protein HU200_064389 [Digitaria exilis]
MHSPAPGRSPTMAAMRSRSLLSTTLWCCLLCYLLLSHVPRAASLSFSFNFSDPSSTCTAHDADLTCSGDAYFHSTENAIELTKNDISDLNYHSVGRVWHAQPVPLWDPTTGEVASFTTSFTFRIKPAGASSPELSADGMAFFLSSRHPSGVPPGSYGRNLGLFTDGSNRNATGDDRVVAVEFDTYRNDEWEEDGNHVGIDVNSIVSAASTSPDKSMKSGDILAAEVAFDNGTETLSVKLWMNGMTSHSVKAKVDMRRSLPEVVAVGFSAATGANVEVHRLLTWSFNSTLASRDEAITSPGAAPPPPVLVPPEAIMSSKKQAKAHSTIAVSAATVFVVVCVLMGFLLRRKFRTWKKHKVVDGGDDLEEEQEHSNDELEKGVGVGPRRYHYGELAAATDNFSEETKLGGGGFGHVYCGCLKVDGQDRHVAIKKFRESSVQGRKEFEAEVKIISRLRHRNLVQLIGWCDCCKGLLIVYELVSEGSLDKHIHNTAMCLTWPERYKIMIGLGSALRYLHSEWEQCVVHGDIKPSNIMLDSSRDAKLGDFGLARLFDHGVQPATTRVVLGTAGYIDPELVNTRRPSTESDMYSFGVVLLELVTGRRPVEEPDDSDELFVLVKWVWRLYSAGDVADAVDERLLRSSGQGNVVGANEEERRQMERALVVGLWCAHPDSSRRPSAAQAMNVLQAAADLALPVLRPQMYGGAEPFLGVGWDDLSVAVTSSTGTGSSATSGGTARSKLMKWSSR